MRHILLLSLALLLGGAAAAQEPGEPPAPPAPAPAMPAARPLEDRIVTTKHRATIGGASTAYTASAGTLVIASHFTSTFTCAVALHPLASVTVTV